ncbi:hypothetical protein [uncultured Flavobacterium sp.]|jgi:hypothetical protein|uniref:hypothetical protein n=1 Tax=uncultured Flavobacterium sp. TaxID=165435 RepID=UPI0030EEED62|tara:strand:- start:8946 stop:9233 length:288 start_codon:yes stop_codon:yes gene_type:complete
MEQSKIDAVESNFHKLEDIKNSCESLIQKIGHLQVDLFNFPNAKLEKFLGKLNGALSGSHSEIVEVTSAYENEVYMPAKGMETFNSAQDEMDEKA